MSVPRFFCEQAIARSGEQVLPESVAHHAVRVLRMSDGDSLVLFDGSGVEVRATLVRRQRDWCMRVEAAERVSRESPLEVVLVQALVATDKMDWLVQKAVELGVSGIQPVRAKRSVVRLSGPRADRRVEHWQQVAVSACEQSGRNGVPGVRPILDLQQYLAAIPQGTRRLVLEPHDGVGLNTLAAPGAATHLVVGPEGGWTDGETAACRLAGCERIRLGPRILRAETAGLAALAAMQVLWGDF